ncbi:MAG TPA: S8 family peptidase [Bacteroidales bacterium]|nr:S8 family peptidase [Bacteroidales bacterium]
MEEFFIFVINTLFSMHKKLIILLLFLTLGLLGLRTPPPKPDADAIPGMLMLQFAPGGNRDFVLGDIERSYAFAGLKPERCLSEQMGIYLYSYDPGRSAGAMLLDQLRSDSRVANAQYDHRISLREVIPDDPQFADQWALRNTGQTGGTPDADIDASDAWDVTVNSGINVMGDTLVMAIVDDGFSLSHPDLDYWKNRQEIPGNGIDDDENGYIDDFDGWNAYYQSGYIQPKDHGQHVAGIAGARGNNGLGVCGVNWNGRVMTVCGSSEVESTVVEAYAYVYKMRSLYDETGGQKGAYVVVTNSSFGVDLGDPEDYPIWGAMYDSLGSLGVLNAAATSNAPWNVDLVGDIPTTFPSDHLIAVTNTTQDDEKNLGAAWGPASIDLGAPGKGILSTRIPDTYGYKTGTSMASPHVTGSIALMYAAADEAFYQRYQQAPKQLSLFMKYILLDAVDTLPGFDTLCTSAGRLNVNTAIQKLINPRIALASDTLKAEVVADSLRADTFRITNLVGFNLPFDVLIENAPAWISFDPPAAFLPGGGSEDLYFYFDAGGYSAGSYYCEMLITDIAGMTDTLVVYMEVIPSQGSGEHNGFSFRMQCYPNPFSSSMNIIIEAETHTEASISIYSAGGRLVFNKEAMLRPGKNMMGWDGHDLNGQLLPAGVYYINTVVDDVHESRRVIRIP